MRHIIQECAQPFFHRKLALQQLEKELKALEDTSRYPIIAAQLLLKDITQGHRLQASDRAQCEAWALALAASTGNPRPEFNINPLTGEPYDEQSSSGYMTIGNIDRLEQTLVARVPRFENKKEKAGFSLSDE